MSKCKTLHDLIQARTALPVPGVYDALGALLVEQAGFLACQISGFGVAAAALGLPDIGILSMRDQVNAVQSMPTRSTSRSWRTVTPASATRSAPTTPCA